MKKHKRQVKRAMNRWCVANTFWSMTKTTLVFLGVIGLLYIFMR